jgi:hypothetical protein
MSTLRVWVGRINGSAFRHLHRWSCVELVP